MKLILKACVCFHLFILIDRVSAVQFFGAQICYFGIVFCLKYHITAEHRVLLKVLYTLAYLLLILCECFQCNDHFSILLCLNCKQKMDYGTIEIILNSGK